MERRSLALFIFWIAVAIACCLVFSRSGRFERNDNSSNLTTRETSDDKDTVDGIKEFAGQPCTEDCSGHEAGYQWAEEHDITNPDDCGGNSQSFIEGCQAYAAERSDMDDPNE